MDKKAELGIGFAVATSLLTACATARTVEAPAAPSNKAITKPTPVVTPEPIGYLNDEGAWVISEDGKMTVSRDGLVVTVSCVPGHEYNGRMLEDYHIDLLTAVTGLKDSSNYWLTVAAPVVLEGEVRIRRDIMSTGLGDQAARVNLHDNGHIFSNRGSNELPIRFLPGRPVTVSVHDDPYTDKEPNFGLPVKQVTVLAPSPCPKSK